MMENPAPATLDERVSRLSNFEFVIYAVLREVTMLSFGVILQYILVAVYSA